MTDTTKQKTELIMKIISESGLDAYGTPEEFSNAIELAIAYGAQHEREECAKLLEQPITHLNPTECCAAKVVQTLRWNFQNLAKAIRARGTK